MKNTRQSVFLFFCVVPGIVLFAIFKGYPAVQVFFKSLYSWSGLVGSPEFVGLQNYNDMFQDEAFLLSLKNTGFLMLVVPVATLFLALLNASVLTRGKLREKGFYRTVFFFPSILSFVVVAILWSFIYHPTMGILSGVLDFLGLGDYSRPWLGDQQTVMWAIAVTMIWQAVGYYMVMYMAGIDSISPELYEAASIDGATSAQQFFKITIPLLWEIIRVTLVFIVSGVIANSFVIVKVMTDGGPDRHSEVVLKYMFDQAFTNSNFGYAMAIAVFIFVASIILSMISNKLTERDA